MLQGVFVLPMTALIVVISIVFYVFYIIIAVMLVVQVIYIVFYVIIAVMFVVQATSTCAPGEVVWRVHNETTDPYPHRVHEEW
jgi:hypothetical protein